MVEHEGQERRRRRVKRERRILVLAGVVCVALPAFAHHKLNRRVSGDLAAQASAFLGLPIELGEASVGLTGTLEIQDVRVGEFFRAKRVMASIAPGAKESSGLAPNELLVDRPSLQLEVDREGNTNLDSMLALRSQHPRAGGSSTGKSSESRLRTLRFVNGSLSANIADVGSLDSRGINLWMREGKVHALFGQTNVDLRQGDTRAKGTLPRAAFDYRRGFGLHRLLADGGTFAVKGPRGRAILREVMVSAGIDGDRVQLTAQTGIDRATGSIKIDIEPTLQGANIVATLASTPLALVAHWMPKNIDPRTTMASGEMAIRADLRQRRDLDLALRDVKFEGLRIDEPALSSRRLELDLAIDAEATIRRTEAGSLLSVEFETVRSGDLNMSGRASGEWHSGESLPELINVSLDLAEVRCDAALNSLPAGLRPSLAGLELRGSMRSRLVLGLARSRSETTHLEVKSGIAGCNVAAEPPTANTRDLTSEYEYRTPDGRTRILGPTNPRFVAYDEMPSYLPKTFVAAEDARFFAHEGFDAHQIERSLAIDMENGKLLRGGSTISQQLTKNLYLNRRRSLARKLQEAILTWRLEANLDKERILEVYLNIIELGDHHTYGVSEASDRWFGVPPEELSILQTAFLAALTPEPTSMSARIREAGGLDPVSAGRVATILRVMRRTKVISSSEYRKAKAEKLQLRSQRSEAHTASRVGPLR